MSNAWQYKEDDWQEHASLKYTIKEKRFNDNFWKSEKSKEVLKEFKVTQEQRGRYIHIVPDYENPEGHLIINLILIGSARTLGFSVDKKGYPIENPKQFRIDFPTPPVDFADAQKQVDKLNRDFYMDFPTWLGHHSREGWEIFKISRDFRDGSQLKRTWCVFRRKI